MHELDSYLVGQKQVPDLSKILLGEDEAHISFNVWQKPVKPQNNLFSDPEIISRLVERGDCPRPCVPDCPMKETNRDSWKRVTLCRGNDNTALHKLHCNLSCCATTTQRTHSLLQGRVVLQMSTDGFTHHGVFAHQHHRFVPKGQADSLHLLGADVVRTHNEAFWIIIQKFLKKKKGRRA